MTWREVRWKGRGSRWKHGRWNGWRSTDGSLTVFDVDGRARSLRPDGIEIAVSGPRGGKRWVLALALAADPIDDSPR